MLRWATLGLLLLLAGCATSPLAQLETATPTLSRGQVAELQKRAQTPETLGIRMELSAETAIFSRINEIDARKTVTLPLVKVPTGDRRAAGGNFRVPIVAATVNGRAGVHVLLDSGSNGQFFGYSLAHELGIPIIGGTKPITSMGIGGAVDNYLAVVPTLRFGSTELRRWLARIGPDSQALSLTHGLLGGKQGMIFGINALKQLSFLTIDSLAGQMTLAPRDQYLPNQTSGFATAVPMRWLGDLPCVDISIDGHGTFPCLLDTGGDYGLLLPRTRAEEFGYWKPGRGAVNASRGVGGAGLDTRYEVKQAKVGGATIVKIPGQTILIGPEPAGGEILLGNQVLRSYRVTFDFRRNVVWLER